MKRFSIQFAAFATAAACSLSAPTLLAQSQLPPGSSDATDRARKLFKQAEEAFGNREFSKARALLLEAWNLSPTFDIATALGQVELRLSMYRSAAEHFDYALRHTPPSTKDVDISATKADLQRAKTEVAEVRVTVNELSSKVFVDGTEVGVAPLSVFVEPGTHTIEARLGSRVATKSSKFERGETFDVALVVPRDAEQASMPSSGLGGDPARDAASNYAPPIATAVAGGVLLFTGATFVVLAASKDSKRKRLIDDLSAKTGTGCGDGTPSPDKCGEISDLADSAPTFRAVGIGSLIGAAAAGVATYLLWPAARDSKKAALWALPSYSVEDRSFRISATARF